MKKTIFFLLCWASMLGVASAATVNGVTPATINGVAPATFNGVSMSTGSTGISFGSYVSAYEDISAETIVTPSIVIPENALIVCAVGYIPAGNAQWENLMFGTNELIPLSWDSAGMNVGGYTLGIWYKEGASAYTGTGTMTFQSTTPFRTIQCATYAGIATTAALDQHACGPNACDTLALSSTNITSSNVTTTVANELVVVMAQRYNNVATFGGSGIYTARQGGSSLLSAFDAAVSSIGTYPNSTVGTSSDADTYMSMIVTFKGAAQ